MRLLLGFFILFAYTLYAKEVNLDQVKVAYTYNFLKNTTWPNESRFNEYNLLVVSKNETLKNMFLMLSSRKLLKEKKIRVLFYDERKSLKNIQAVYVDQEQSSMYDKLFDDYESQNTLFISDEYSDQKKVMFNLLYNGEIVTFEINKANILNRSLQISPDVILLGGTEIDVAKLYKSSQIELKEQKETITQLGKKIKEKNIELADKIAAIETQRAELANLKTKINFQKEIINTQLRQIEDSEETLRQHHVELDTLRQQIESERQKLSVEEEKIKTQEAAFGRILHSLQVKQTEIKRAKEELQQLNARIEQQKQNLIQKDGVIASQQEAITSLLLLSLIIIVLTVYVIKQNRLLNSLSRTDSLTGLFNRRMVMEKLQDEIQKYNRYGIPFSILLIDADNFKTINDTYGHDTGDDILKKISDLMKQHTRTTDYCVRWGGEEFLILASNTDLDHACTLAEHFRKTVETNDFDIGFNVTISIGITTIHTNQTLEELIKTADNALYRAKENGRNCIVF